VGGEQARQPRRIAARHAAFGRDPINPCMPPRRRQPRGVSRRIRVMDKAEIELGFGAQLQPFERREIRVVGAVFGYRHVEILDRALDAGADGVRHLDHEAHVFRLHKMLVSRTAVAEVIAELDRGRHGVADAG
jgi:hypothetical protein